MKFSRVKFYSSTVGICTLICNFAGNDDMPSNSDDEVTPPKKQKVDSSTSEESSGELQCNYLGGVCFIP